MAGFRSVTYEICDTTEEQIDSIFAKVLAAIPYRLAGRTPPKSSFAKFAGITGNKQDVWRDYSDGFYRGFMRDDSSGIRLQLTYWMSDNSDSIILCMMWDRPGIKSKFFSRSEVNSLINIWESAIEKQFRTVGLEYSRTS